MINIPEKDFKELTKLIYDSFGIVLNDSKKSLVLNRLTKAVNREKFADFNELFTHLKQDKSGKMLQVIANYMSTNHTYFYREPQHFDYYLNTALAEVCKNIKDNDLRVWCAAAATGEEPYMLAMLQKEFFGKQLSQWKAGLLATDISEKALRIASTGIYPKDELTPLPNGYAKKYFSQFSDQYEAKPEIKSMITYRKLNLMHPLKFKKPIHITFCRNVMIYFDEQTKIDLVERIYDKTAPGGYLFIGHSETIPRDKTRFKYIMPAVYRKI